VRSVDVLILGAGASGLMAASTAARRGRRVLLADHGRRAGAKVRISGGGRCNATNLQACAANYHSRNPHFVKSALARFGPRNFLEFLDKREVGWREEEQGQVFLVTGGVHLADMLERECASLGVELLLGRPVHDVRKEGTLFTAEIGGEPVASESLVVATGGLSWPKLGASDLGLRIARGFGHAVVETRPGLVPLTFSKWPFVHLSGISLTATVSCCGEAFTGGLLFTHEGLSGPAVLQASSLFKPGEVLVVDLLPGTPVAELLAGASEKSMCKTVLGATLPARVVESLQPQELSRKQVANLSKADLSRIARSIHEWVVSPSGTGGWAKAEVTVGGVDTAGLSSKTMESAVISGLFFTGEVMDVTGWLGGYNLQWAWSSGVAAGNAA
jgi:predicted Rossmann fold flavoprotein